MRMNARKTYHTAGMDSLGRLHGLAVVQVEAKAVPHRVDAGIHVHPDGGIHGFVQIPGDLLDHEQLVEVIDMDTCSLGNCPAECRFGFIGAVVKDVVAGDAVASGHLVLVFTHHLGPGTFLVEDVADGIQVIGLIGPGELDLRIAGGKGPEGVPEGASNAPFAEHEDRTAVARHDLLNRHIVDGAFRFQGLGSSELLGDPGNMSNDVRALIGFLIHYATFSICFSSVFHLRWSSLTVVIFR